MSAPERVVSLLPAATEIICALGAEARLVGRSHECDVPDSIESLTVCSRTRIDLDAAGAVINGQVEDVLRHGLSVFEVLAEPLQELTPDLVVTQIQCEVCAVSADDVERALATWTDSHPALVSLEPNALRDVLADIQRVAVALGIPEQGQRLRNEMRTRMRDIDGIANGVPGAPSVICVEWIEPLMAAGNWYPSWWISPAATTAWERPAFIHRGSSGNKSSMRTRTFLLSCPAASTCNAPVRKRPHSSHFPALAISPPYVTTRSSPSTATATSTALVQGWWSPWKSLPKSSTPIVSTSGIKARVGRG